MNAQLQLLADDTQFSDVKIAEVTAEPKGCSVKFDDGWSFYVPGEPGIEPKVGMTARLYGKGTGYRVRGLALDGQTVFYRSHAEDEAHHEQQLYGATIQDWLDRWDAGRTVWSISMGGLGPGYEQAIQVTVVEIIRHMLAADYVAESWDDQEAWKADLSKIEAWSHGDETIKELGLSGAMWGAAINLACMLYRHGPIVVMTDKRVKDRHIQVSKKFP